MRSFLYSRGRNFSINTLTGVLSVTKPCLKRKKKKKKITWAACGFTETGNKKRHWDFYVQDTFSWGVQHLQPRWFSSLRERSTPPDHPPVDQNTSSVWDTAQNQHWHWAINKHSPYLKNVHRISLHVTDDGIDIARHLCFGKVFKHTHDVALREDASRDALRLVLWVWLHNFWGWTENIYIRASI